MSEQGGGASVAVTGLSLRGPRGWVYRDVSFEAARGSLIAVEGPAGSGRTALLLTLAGRMKPAEGTADVDGLSITEQSSRVRRIAALGPMPGVNEPDGELSVGAHLREQQQLHAPVLALPSRRTATARAAAVLAAVGLDPAALPAGLRTPTRELDQLDTLRLGLALALLGRPRLICVDDVDDRLHSAERLAAWRLLRTLADSGVTVIASSTDTGDPVIGQLSDVTVRLGSNDTDRPTRPAALSEENTDARV